MNRSTPGLPVHHQLPEFTQTHVHRVSDAIPHYKIKSLKFEKQKIITILKHIKTITVHLSCIYLKKLGWSYCNDSISEIQKLSDPTLFAQSETFSDAYFMNLIAFQTLLLTWIHLHLTQ